MASHPHLSVQVLATEGVIYSGDVLAVSGTNESGPFAILPGHINFISVVRGSVVLHEGGRRAKKIAVAHGVIFCRRDTVEIYVTATAPALPPVLPSAGPPAPGPAPRAA